MKVVFICGPFRGKTAWDVEQNVRRAERVAWLVAREGAMPLCPHANTRFFNGTLTDEFWLAGTMALMCLCHAVVLVPGWQQSAGSRGEYAEAIDREMPVFVARDTIIWPSVPIPRWGYFHHWLHNGWLAPEETRRAMAAYRDVLAERYGAMTVDGASVRG